MKAIVYHRYGSPGDVLEVQEMVTPVPADGEVLVRVHAVSVNSWDLDMLLGRPWEYRVFSGLIKPRNKKIHGCDIAGRVEAVGSDVRHFKVGDAVFGDLAEDGWGAFAEFVCAPESHLLLKPKDLTFEEAACLPHGGNLAVQGLIDCGRIGSGEKVLINGGGGSTGTLAIQIAKLFDTEVTAVDRPEKLAVMRGLGADHVLDYTTEDFTRNGQLYDVVFDVKTTRSPFAYRRVLRPGGRYVTVGGNTSRILQLFLIRKLVGPYAMHILSYKANKDLPYLLTLFQAGKLRPVIDRCFPFEKTADAFRYFGEGTCRGKVVINCFGSMGQSGQYRRP